MHKENKLHVVYSCSGSSNVAQLTNHLAVKLDRDGIAEMSCITGVGGNVKPLVHKAKQAEKIIVIDGCKLQCALQCLQNQNIEPDIHFTVTEDFQIKKIFHEDFSPEDADKIYNAVSEKIKTL
ncbi:MAG: putative zinc-binding protein [Ignavibacteriales bacterium]|nr:putative zinc-binding protein [Ignavibacteriales bacterium]